MKENWKKIAVSIPIGALFLWLAFKNVDVDEVLKSFENISYGWIPGFIFVSVLSYLVRAERWILLLGEERAKAHRSTFNAGVFFGYLMNYIIPRLGEVSRCMYVSKKDSIPLLTLIGTVVLERVIDTLMLLMMVIILFVYVITDEHTIISLFGKENAEILLGMGSYESVGLIVGIIVAGIFFMWLGMKILKVVANREDFFGKMAQKISGLLDVFIKGLTNIRKVHNWPYFIILTAILWLCYTLMVLIPISMFDLGAQYGIGFADSAIIMVLSAIGVALPSPGAIGTYHWFVKQTLYVLYNVPEIIGLAYAFVTHSSMLLLILVAAPIGIGLNSFILRKRDR
ncbi:flippase-like domain-containing protein [bacterium]|nr:MAG: flippase-like domain-containing protein [bacterium]